MSNELPPETARRILDMNSGLREHLAEPEYYHLPDPLLPEDLAALEACDPDKVKKTSIISAGLACIIDGPGIYDKYERAGWVKREEPKAEEWAPWVKLAKVGERPDGVEFGEDEWIQSRWDNGREPRGLARGCWTRATHYRRKRIRCVYEAFGRENDLYKGHCIWTINDEGIDRPDDMPPGHYCLRGSTWTKATVPEVTAAKAGRDPNGVIAWHGGECPVGVGIPTRIYRRDGTVVVIIDPQRWRWAHTEDRPHWDIIAYEVTP